MMMESAVLYTFSTIPQTLGAAFAVLAAFVLYRFQADTPLPADIHEMMQMQVWEDQNILREKLRTAGIQGFVQTLDLWQARPDKIKISKSGPQHEAYLRLKAISELPEVKAPLRRAFIATGMVIVLSVVALCFEKWLSVYDCRAMIALGLGVIGLVICLLLYWRLMKPLIFNRQ